MPPRPCARIQSSFAFQARSLIVLDTDVLVRPLVGDDQARAHQAKLYFGAILIAPSKGC